MVVVIPSGGRPVKLSEIAPSHQPRVPPSAAARFWLTIAQLGVYSTRRESYDAAVRAANLYRELNDEQRGFQALTFAAVQGTRFATIAEMGTQIEQAARLEQAEWPARQRAKLQFARCFWYARQSRFEEALACAQRQVQICRGGGVEVGALYAMSNVTLMLVQLGRAQEALEDAKTAIARLHVLGADAGAGHLYFSATTALLSLDRIDDAMIAARNAYPRLMHEGDQHRLLLPLALLNALSGRGDVAVRIDAFDDAIRARIGENASVDAPLLVGRLDPLLAAASLSGERARLAAEGPALREAEAFRLAFGDTA